MLRALFNHCACPKPCCSRVARRIQRCLWHLGCRSDCAPLQAGIPSRAGGKWSCVMPRGPRAVTHTQSTVPSVSLKPELSLALHWVVLGRCPLFSFIVYAPEGNRFAQSSGKQHFPPLLSLFISSDNCCRPGGPVLSPSHPPCRCLKSHPRVCACRQNPRRALPAGRGNRCFPARYPLTTYGSA